MRASDILTSPGVSVTPGIKRVSVMGDNALAGIVSRASLVQVP